ALILLAVPLAAAGFARLIKLFCLKSRREILARKILNRSDEPSANDTPHKKVDHSSFQITRPKSPNILSTRGQKNFSGTSGLKHSKRVFGLMVASNVSTMNYPLIC